MKTTILSEFVRGQRRGMTGGIRMGRLEGTVLGLNEALIIVEKYLAAVPKDEYAPELNQVFRDGQRRAADDLSAKIRAATVIAKKKIPRRKE
jgi:hypothetical protein